MNGQDLQAILQKIHPKFAYELMALEIDLDDQSDNSTPKINNITRLIQLYMSAVQILEGRSDDRFKYFNKKIQRLMKKKRVVQQLHVASTGRIADKQALSQSLKVEISQRKNQHQLQIFLNKQQFDSKKIRQMMKATQSKIKVFEKNVNSNLKKQQDMIEQRRKIRKLKSDAGSVSKFDTDFKRQFQSPHAKNIRTDKQLDQYFNIGSPNKPIKRTGSTQKIIDKAEVKKANYNKLKAMVI